MASELCPTRVSRKSVLQESPTEWRKYCARVSHKGVLQECLLQDSQIFWALVFEYVVAFGFVGSIRFFTKCFEELKEELFKLAPLIAL